LPAPVPLFLSLFQVGSGKSSVLAAMLGEMRLCFGGLARRGRVAYLAQRPFIQNSTLKDNIIFGHDEQVEEGGRQSTVEGGKGGRYQRVLEECALLPDLKVTRALNQRLAPRLALVSLRHDSCHRTHSSPDSPIGPGLAGGRPDGDRRARHQSLRGPEGARGPGTCRV